MGFRRTMIRDNGQERMSAPGDSISLGYNPLEVTTDANTTITMASAANGLIVRTGLTLGRTDTFDTAANIVAALVAMGYTVGENVNFVYANHSGQTITLAAGTGNTLKGTAALTTGLSREVVVQLNNVTAGSEACTIWAI